MKGEDQLEQYLLHTAGLEPDLVSGLLPQLELREGSSNVSEEERSVTFTGEGTELKGRHFSGYNLLVIDWWGALSMTGKAVGLGGAIWKKNAPGIVKGLFDLVGEFRKQMMTELEGNLAQVLWNLYLYQQTGQATFTMQEALVAHNNLSTDDLPADQFSKLMKELYDARILAYQPSDSTYLIAERITYER